MPNDFQTAWRKNQGNLLLVLAGLATITVSAVWYFDALPKIELVSGSGDPTLARTITRQPTVLVATVLTPPATSERQVVGQVLIFQPFGQLTQENAPVAQQDFVVGESPVQVVLFTTLPPGEYAAVAYLDTNANGFLDFDGNGDPSEPFQLSYPRSAKVSDTGPYNLSDGEFRIRSGQPTNIRFRFSKLQATPDSEN